jgi:hypothetical protein
MMALTKLTSPMTLRLTAARTLSPERNSDYAPIFSKSKEILFFISLLEKLAA